METKEVQADAPEEVPEKKPVRECAGFPRIPVILENGQEVLV